jgi:hypothetical protein
MASSSSLFTHKAMRCRISLTRRIYPSSLSSFCSAARIIEDDNSTLSNWTTPRRSFQTYISKNCQQQTIHKQQRHQTQHLPAGENQIIQNIDYCYYDRHHRQQRYFSSSTATEDDEEVDNDINFPSRSPSSSTSESDVIDFEIKRRKVADVPIREVLDVSLFCGFMSSTVVAVHCSPITFQKLYSLYFFQTD